MRHATLQELPAEMRDVVQNELHGGEKLIWSQQPVPRLWSAGTIAPVLFGIPWTAFSIFWIAGAANATSSAPSNFGPGRFFPLFGVPFLLIGIGMLTAPLWNRRALRKSVYAITDRRAIVFNAGVFGSRTVQSFDPDRLTSMERVERADGTGDLIFEQFTTRRGTGHTTVRRGFVSVADVREVDVLIRQTLLKDRTRTIQGT